VRNKKTLAVAAAALSGALLAAGCSSGGSGGTSGGTDWSKETSVVPGGGMKALIAAAKKEGQLNVITLPANWANYGAIMKDFTAKYGIKINYANPDGSSQDEINAMVQLRTVPGTGRTGYGNRVRDQGRSGEAARQVPGGGVE